MAQYYMGAYTSDQLMEMERRRALSPKVVTKIYGGEVRVTAPECDQLNQYSRKLASMRYPHWAIITGPAWWAELKEEFAHRGEDNQYHLESWNSIMAPKWAQSYQVFRLLFGWRSKHGRL